MFTYSKYNLYCYIYIYICLPRSLKNPYQTIFAKTVITNNYNSFCIFIIGFASFSQKPLLKFIYEYELSRNI